MKKIIRYKKEYFCLANDLYYYIIHKHASIKYHCENGRFSDYKYNRLYNRNYKDSFLTFYVIKHFKENMNYSPNFPVLLLKKSKEDY